MSTLFQSYEEEYRDSVKSINDGLAALRATLNRDAPGYKAPPATGPGSRLQCGAHLLALLSGVKDLLNNMEYESNDVSPAQRPALKDRLAECRATAQALEAEIGKARSDGAAADRLDLFGGAAQRESLSGASGGGGLDDETVRHRMLMMQNTEKVKQASSTLTRAERLLNETEDVGTEALKGLRTQTEAMHHIHTTTIAVNEEITESGKIINKMRRTMVKHKLMLIGIIIVLMLLIVVAIYVSVVKHNQQKPVEPMQHSTPVPSLPSLKPNDNGGIPSD